MAGRDADSQVAHSLLTPQDLAKTNQVFVAPTEPAAAEQYLQLGD